MLLRSRAGLTGLAVIGFLGHLAHSSLPNIGVLYMMYRYHWDERAVGFVMAAVGLCSMIVQGGVIGLAVKHLGESRAMLVGLAFGIAGFAVFGLAATGTGFVAGIPLLALWGIANAATLALMSSRVDASQQGQLQGANASLIGIASLIGPALFTQSFAWSIGATAIVHLPGATFLVATAFLVAAMTVAIAVTRPSRGVSKV
jgi:DHA1 family tetracycline resistance protein-like MFS transporter